MTKKIIVYKEEFEGHKINICIACDGAELGEVFTEIDDRYKGGYTLKDLAEGRVLRIAKNNIKRGRYNKC